MSSKNIELARGSARVAKLYGVPLLGLSGSAHEEACKELGVELIPGAVFALSPSVARSLFRPQNGTATFNT